MAYEQQNNSGILFRNDRRENDRQPEFTGSITVAGVPYYLSAWVKQGNKGKFFSLAIKPKDEATAQPKPAGGGARPHDFDDEISF